MPTAYRTVCVAALGYSPFRCGPGPDWSWIEKELTAHFAHEFVGDSSGTASSVVAARFTGQRLSVRGGPVGTRMGATRLISQRVFVAFAPRCDRMPYGAVAFCYFTDGHAVSDPSEGAQSDLDSNAC